MAKTNPLTLNPSNPDDDDLDDGPGPMAVPTSADPAWLAPLRSAVGAHHGHRGAAEADATRAARENLEPLAAEMKALLDRVRALGQEHGPELAAAMRELERVPLVAPVRQAHDQAYALVLDLQRAITGTATQLDTALREVGSMSAGQLLAGQDRYPREALRLSRNAPSAIVDGMVRLRAAMTELARKVRTAPVVVAPPGAPFIPPAEPRQRTAVGVTEVHP